MGRLPRLGTLGRWCVERQAWMAASRWCEAFCGAGAALYWTVQTVAPSAGSVAAVTEMSRASLGTSRWCSMSVSRPPVMVAVGRPRRARTTPPR